MKKWVFCVLVLLLLGYAFVKFKVSDLSAIPLDKITLTDDNPQAPADRGFTIKITGSRFIGAICCWSIKTIRFRIKVRRRKHSVWFNMMNYSKVLA